MLKQLAAPEVVRNATRAATRRRRQLGVLVSFSTAAAQSQRLSSSRRARVVRFTRDVLVAATLGLVGDVLCQCVVEKHAWPFDETSNDDDGVEPFDSRRAAALMAFGGVYTGGFLHFLYKVYPPLVTHAAARFKFLPRRVRAALRLRTSVVHAAACAIVDNVHCGLFYIPVYFFVIEAPENSGGQWAHLRASWLETYVSCTAFWVPFMCANFFFVPAHLRIAAMTTANLAWNVVIDYQAHNTTTAASKKVTQVSSPDKKTASLRMA